MELTKLEYSIIEKVKAGIKSDNAKSPWDSDKWYMKFTKDNQDGIFLKDAPLNTPLMVVTESLGTLYKHDRGQAIMRGSVLVRVADNEIVCMDAHSWSIIGADSDDLVKYKNNGTFEFDLLNGYGTVKEIEKVIV